MLTSWHSYREFREWKRVITWFCRNGFWKVLCSSGSHWHVARFRGNKNGKLSGFSGAKLVSYRVPCEEDWEVIRVPGSKNLTYQHSPEQNWEVNGYLGNRTTRNLKGFYQVKQVLLSRAYHQPHLNLEKRLLNSQEIVWFSQFYALRNAWLLILWREMFWSSLRLILTIFPSQNRLVILQDIARIIVQDIAK